MFETPVDPLLTALKREVRADRPANAFARADFAAVWMMSCTKEVTAPYAGVQSRQTKKALTLATGSFNGQCMPGRGSCNHTKKKRHVAQNFVVGSVPEKLRNNES